jgi:hypothetical protein
LQLLHDSGLGQAVEHRTVSPRLFRVTRTGVMRFAEGIGNESSLHSNRSRRATSMRQDGDRSPLWSAAR